MQTSKEYELQTINGEPLLIPKEESDKSIIRLDEISAYLWQEADKREEFTLDTLAEFLLNEYDVDKATACEDCEEIIAVWREMGIIA